MKKVRFLLVGPGKVGMSLGKAWLRAGHRCVGVEGGRPGARARARALLGVRRRPRKRSTSPAPFDLLLIAVPDSQVLGVARSWADRVRWEGRIVLHTSGVLGDSVLAPLRRRGARVASLHPLLSFPRPLLDPGSFRGAFFGVEGQRRASRFARRLVRDAGGRPLEIRGDRKPLYHLGACLSSGYLLALIDAAATRVAAGAADPALLRRAFLSLAESALRNAGRSGLEAALTGPILRGDLVTLAAHLSGLTALPPGWKRLHRTLAGHTLSLALRSRRITPSQALRIRRLLDKEKI